MSPDAGSFPLGSLRPPRLVVMVAFEAVEILDVTGPVAMFAGANDVLAEDGVPPVYRLVLGAPEAGPVATSSGMALVAERTLSDLVSEEPDTLIVAGGPGTRHAATRCAVVPAVARLASRARRVVSVCTGAFVLAEAGLLDGRRVATHWAHADDLARERPQVRVEVDPIWIRDGRVWTSAGVTAGMDLALALIEDDLGRDLALTVARRRVMFLKRPGGQSQFSGLLAAQSAGDGLSAGIARARALVLDRAGDEDLSIERLAAAAGMSSRTFARRFRAETGSTPGRYVELARIEIARRLLEDSGRGVDAVASLSGFGTREAMRRSFRRRLGITPQDYRARFRRTPSPDELARAPMETPS